MLREARFAARAAAVLVAALATVLSGCAGLAPPAPAPEPTAVSPPPPPISAPAPKPSAGGYYKDDGPGDSPPGNLAVVPDAVPKAEPLHRFANRPYKIEGKDYAPMSSVQTASGSFRQTGIGSWYGRRFHGKPTSSGEQYDMYAMTAAHPTLPIPSYARVTNVANGRSVVVRINDRGPFHSDRIIDLSYTAAWKLGYIEAGSARVEVESLTPGEGAQVASAATTVRQLTPIAAASSAVAAKALYLQLGAFSSREAADSARERVAAQLSGLAERVELAPGGAPFRVQAGPYPSQDEARAVAQRLQTEFGLRAIVIER
jgi:rare lipoprotein A